MSEKIGIGIVTFNRPELFGKCIASMSSSVKLYVAITGSPYDPSLFKKAGEVWQFKTDTCVGKGKNKLFEMMIKDGCKHMFIVEDDLEITDVNVFDIYIRHSKETGILHLNYGYHGPGNKRDGLPAPRTTVSYKSNVKIAMNANCVGAFSYYDSRTISKVGFIDEHFNNCWDHVEHTYRIIKAGMTTPFWWFADVQDSSNYIKDCDPTLSNSVIRRKGDEWVKTLSEGAQYFKNKHGRHPLEIPQGDLDEVVESLKSLKTTYSIK